MIGRLPIVLLALAAAAQDPQSQDARMRARAARELARQSSAVIPKLEPLLADSVFEVRLEAVKALVAIGTQHSLAPLARATRDNDPEIQFRATDGLVNFYLPGYVQTGLTASLRRVGSGIKAQFTDTNDQVIPAHIEVRPEIIVALGQLARGGVSFDVRAGAARALGILRGKAAIPDLLAALRTKDDQVMLESLVALQKIAEPSAGPEVAFLLRDLNERIQVAAIETTGLLRNREAGPRLREVLQRAESVKVRRAALTALAMMAEEPTRPLFRTYLQDKDDGLRAAAAEGFARLKNPADRPALEKAFGEERKMNPRLSLAFALVSGGRTEPGEFSPLQYLVNTLNSRLYRGVAQAFLIELARETTVRRSLYPMLRIGAKEEKIGLAQILASSGDQEALAYVEPLMRDADAEVGQAAIRAMQAIRARTP